MCPKKVPFQKESNLSTTIFQGTSEFYWEKAAVPGKNGNKAHAYHVVGDL